jgi:Tfp pilus assembly protein PilF
LNSRDSLLAGLLLALTVLAYVPAMQAGFVWDDDSYVSENPTLRSVDGLGLIWLDPDSSPQYYPLVFSSFWLEYQLWGPVPTGYHVVNVLLHALSVLLLWCLLRQLGIPGAWLVAAVFALHPVHVESVAWVTERKNVLSTVFYLGSAIGLLRYFGLAGASESGRSRSRWYIAGLLLFVGALLSKTVTASLPAAVLLVLWWKRGAISRREIGALAPLFLLGLVTGLATAWLERHHVGALGPEWEMTFAERLLVAGRAIWFYAAKLVWPRELIFNYPRWSIDAHALWQWIYPLGVVAVVVGLWAARKKVGRGPLVGVLFFCGTLFPALGFINVYPFRYSFVADHFQYLASIGLLALLVGAAADLASRLPVLGRRAAKLLVTTVLILLAAQTWVQCQSYRDIETLWTTTLERNPASWMAHVNLGKEKVRQGRLDDAVVHFEQAVSIRPTNDKAHYNLGLTLARQGRTVEAVEAYSAAIRLNSDHLQAHVNLGNLLAGLDRFEEAIGHYREALRVAPDSVEVHNNLANGLAGQGHFDAAIEHYETALQLSPGHRMARENLSRVRELLLERSQEPENVR